MLNIWSCLSAVGAVSLFVAPALAAGGRASVENALATAQQTGRPLFVMAGSES